jgi:ATP-binding cassette, sub-family E, member 1
MAKDTRIAIIDKNKCQPKTCNYLCKRLCPGVRMGEDTILIDETNKLPIIDEVLCTGCGICVNRCPQKAIKIIKIDVSFDFPLHQFGKNSFRLFKVPSTQKGYISGIIGKNGVGKTTAINIISGNLIPNLGDYKNVGDIDKVVDFYKGKDLQKHFIDIKEKKTNLSYKIQKVEDIPKFFNNKIIDLLNKTTDNQNKINEIIKELDLKEIINKTPQEISGGELQRVAIAACLLKEADIYFLDEYSTFLDIKQKFNVARYLRKKINENISITVVEHDLAILDYLSDFIEVMFGTVNAYGVCSEKKTTKKGINEFLDGFLKEENIRIREHPINFVSAKEKSSKVSTSFIKYPSLEKKLGNFSLKVNEGDISCGEVVGILGPNAIGKTTFIKMLAGELPSDNISLNLNHKVSYKPQYIKLDEDLTVRELFNKKEVILDVFEIDVKKQLGLDKILDQEIKSLSGGELQKVAVGYCLSQEADIYLIDEPSAFLDVELRLIVANVIKNRINKGGVCAFIVDHDLLFLDYISDKVLLFEGTPGKNGVAKEISTIESSFNKFLKTQDITFRQDPQTKRPRANKPGSQKDQEQKKDNKYYYII